MMITDKLKEIPLVKKDVTDILIDKRLFFFKEQKCGGTIVWSSFLKMKATNWRKQRIPKDILGSDRQHMPRTQQLARTHQKSIEMIGGGKSSVDHWG